jgi:heme/copper-type cytochrome/quinol oxidase subunit 2
MDTPTTFRELVEGILELINIAIPAIFGIVFLVIVWKVIDAWIINGGDPTKRQEGKRLLLVAVVVFVLMVVTWGIVALLRNALFGI